MAIGVNWVNVCPQRSQLEMVRYNWQLLTVANLPVGSLARVRPPVTPQSVSSGESFAAHLAHVGLLPRVHGRVDPQVDLSQEAFPANLKTNHQQKFNRTIFLLPRK